MKKIILALLAFSLSTSAFAQLDWGVKGGLNISNVRDMDMDCKASIHLGAFAEFPINHLVSIQPELVYSRQGCYDKINGIKTWLRLNYLNIPVLAKLYVLDNLSVDMGPQFGFMLNAKIKAKDGNTTVKTSISDHKKTFDISWAIGLSYKINKRIDVSTRYNLGLNKCLELDDAKPKNSVVQIGAGYRF